VEQVQGQQIALLNKNRKNHLHRLNMITQIDAKKMREKNTTSSALAYSQASPSNPRSQSQYPSTQLPLRLHSPNLDFGQDGKLIVQNINNHISRSYSGFRNEKPRRKFYIIEYSWTML
jgi:hypothetical protein